MRCSFCDDPAAHPATGCQYGARTVACYRCTVDCWAWVRRHVNGKGLRPRASGQPRSGLTFYEAAAIGLGEPDDCRSR